MAVYDLADPETKLPAQLVLDTSLLLACRVGDDNPNAGAVQDFITRLGQQIVAYRTVAWLLPPVLQECYHIILSRALRRAWEKQPPESRAPNWLVAYKQRPGLLAAGFAELTTFDEILASIPLTPTVRISVCRQRASCGRTNAPFYHHLPPVAPGRLHPGRS